MSKENMEAYIRGQMSFEPDSLEKLKDLLKMLPGLALNLNRDELYSRRQLSDQAKDAVAAATLKMWSANKIFAEKGLDSTFWSLLSIDDSDKGIDASRKINDTMVKGTAQARGEVVTKRVNEAMELLTKVVQGSMKDQELVKNYEKLHLISNLADSAKKFRELTRAEDPAKRIDVAPDILEKLRLLEVHSPKMRFTVERVKMIASANYAVLNLDYLLTADDKTYSLLDEYLGNNLLKEEKNTLKRSHAEHEIKTSTQSARKYLAAVRKENLMEQITNDFPEEKSFTKLKFVGVNGINVTADFGSGDRYMDVDQKFHQGHVLVTSPSNDTACYHVNADGTLRKAKSNEVLNGVASELENALKVMREANKGLFIGSRAYARTLSQLEKLAKDVAASGNPPSSAEISEMKRRLSTAIHNCETYRNTHKPDTKQRNYNAARPLALLPQRRRVRHEAIDLALDVCNRHLSKLSLYEDAKEAENEATAKFYRGGKSFYSKVNNSAEAVRSKFKDVYPRIRRSRAGVVAEELRASIEERLEKVLGGDLKEAGTVMADMVLLEVMKGGRKTNSYDQFDVSPGEIEWALSKDPDQVKAFFRNHPFIKNMTREMSMEKFSKFIMDNGAEKMADHMLRVRRENFSNFKDDLSRELNKVPGMDKKP